MSFDKKKKIIIVVVLTMIMVFIMFYNGLTIKQYTIITEKLRNNQSIRIVLIADLHSHIYGENQKDLVSLIKKSEPDIIALCGDIADDVEPIKGTELFLENIKDIVPIYYVSGNHEYWSNDINSIKSTIRSYGVEILENEYKEINISGVNLIIGGVDDPEIVGYKDNNYDWTGEMNKRFDEIKGSSSYKILLSHRPERIEEYKKLPVDLVLSGHAHGGQIRIPFFVNGVFSPNQGWFPKYAGGIYKHKELYHVVSRGVSYNPRLPRIFNPPEIVVIDIKGTKKQDIGMTK